jgi:SAM-dependent methyltransferase
MTRRQDRTKSAYDLQWNRYRIVRPDEDLATFRNRTGLTREVLAGATVLDAGCGMGRYMRVAAALGAATVVGLDLSWAVRAADELNRDLPGLSVVRGDLLRPPFAEGSFDHIYSLGVLDHTPDPRRAFLELARLLKPGGRIAVWVYEKERPFLEWMKDVQRAVSTRLPLPWLERASRLSAPLGGWKRKLMASRAWPVSRLGVALHVLTLGVPMHPDPEVRICDTLDWYAPRFMSRHTRAEVEGWFQEAGLAAIEDLSPGQEFYHEGQGHGVNIAGRRRCSPPGESPPLIVPGSGP